MKTENHEPQTTTSLQHFSAACLNKVQELKSRLKAQFAAEYGGSIHPTLLQQAINEADSLAATTEFPCLLFPTLAEEKIQSADAWNRRQRAIREQTWAQAA